MQAEEERFADGCDKRRMQKGRDGRGKRCMVPIKHDAILTGNTEGQEETILARREGSDTKCDGSLQRSSFLQSLAKKITPAVQIGAHLVQHVELTTAGK